MRRITDLGGRVIFWGRWRVEGILAVSRAIGDRHLKPYVTPEPEVCEWALTDRDCFLVLATDGIWCVFGRGVVRVGWCVVIVGMDTRLHTHTPNQKHTRRDVLSNEAVAQLVTNASHDPKWAARRLCEEAFLHGSLDNMAVVVVDLREHAANHFHHYYIHTESHRATATVTTTAAGGGVVPVEALAAAAASVPAEEEVEEEGEGVFFDSRDGEEGDGPGVALSAAERRFRRNVTVCVRSRSSAGGGGGEAEQERVLLTPASSSSSPGPSHLVSPSKRGGGLAGLLKHRRSSKQHQHQQQSPIGGLGGGGKQGGSQGPSPKKSS